MRGLVALVLVVPAWAHAEVSMGAAVGAGAQGAATYGALDLRLDAAWPHVRLGLGARGVWEPCRSRSLVSCFASRRRSSGSTSSTCTSLRINIWTTLAIQVPIAWLLGFGLGLGESGIWWSFPISFVAKSALNYIELRRERWAVTGVRMSRNV
jgi:hypothetical protein